MLRYSIHSSSFAARNPFSPCWMTSGFDAIGAPTGNDSESHILRGFHNEFVFIPRILRKRDKPDLNFSQILDFGFSVPFLRGIVHVFKPEIFTADKMKSGDFPVLKLLAEAFRPIWYCLKWSDCRSSRCKLLQYFRETADSGIFPHRQCSELARCFTELAWHVLADMRGIDHHDLAHPNDLFDLAEKLQIWKITVRRTFIGHKKRVVEPDKWSVWRRAAIFSRNADLKALTFTVNKNRVVSVQISQKFDAICISRHHFKGFCDISAALIQDFP